MPPLVPLPFSLSLASMAFLAKLIVYLDKSSCAVMVSTLTMASLLFFLRIIVSMVIAFESLISWMPMYGEMKLAFFVYLWYPKTKGSDVVYDTFLRPIVMQYEPNIEHRLLHLRAKSGQLLNFYAKNFADKGTAFFMDVLRYVVSDKAEGSNLEQRNKKSGTGWSPFATKRRPPSPPPQQEPLFDNPDAAAVAEVLRSAINPKPRRAHDGKDYY
ncbi:hypothetical protein QYE76_002917 [Lolium multiflorum]|uniref:HVA22-like protein n=1 Tax=Lolium multiflorum TaxID=4521 RepID=A0AAD8RQK2_LOLMU|nr:hypothetical protein QYE76_002917 [Lolium multiflorum]